MKSIREYIEIVESELVARNEAAILEAAQTAASGPTPQAAKALAKADKTQKQWVDGERYSFTDPDGTGARWVMDYSTQPGRQVGSTGLSGIFSKATTKHRGENRYTGTDTGANVGVQNIARNKADFAKATQSGQAAQPAKTVPTPDPKVLALQKELIAKGAQIKADGIMGPKTQAAQAQFGSGQAAQPAKSLPPNTVVQGPNPGIDDATRAAAMAAVGGNPAAPTQPAAPGTGQPGPTVAAAQGQDPNNPLKPAAQPQASPEQVAQFMAQAKKTPGLGQPAQAAQPAATPAPAQTGTPAQPYYTQDPSTMKVYKEDQELLSIVHLAGLK